MNAIQKLRQLAELFGSGEDPLRAQREWPLAERLLSRLPVDQAEARRICAAQDAAGLHAMLDRLEKPDTPAPPRTPPTDEGGDGFTHDDKAAAMRAFKKRLRVLRLADESRLGGRYTSGGRHSSIDAIEPPDTHPPAMWKALAAEGRLKDTGGGFYSLP